MIVQYPFTEHVEILFPLAHLCSVKQKEPRRLPSTCSTATFRDEAGGVRRSKKGKEMPLLFKGMIVEHLLQRLVCPLGEFGLGKVKRRSEVLRKMEALLRIGTTRESFFYRLKSKHLILLSSSSFQCGKVHLQVSSHSHLPQREARSRGQIKSKTLLEAPSEVVDALLSIMENHGSARGVNAFTNKQLPLSTRLLTASSPKNVEKPQTEEEVNSRSELITDSNCSPSRISISSSNVLRNIEANKENTPSEALKTKNNKSVKFLEEPKKNPLDMLNMAKVGLRCLNVTVKAKVAKMAFQAFTQLKFYDIVNIQPEERHREIEHSLALLNENLEKQEQIMELHQELEMKCQEIQTMEEEITVFKRVLKLSVFKNIEHSLKKYTMEAFSRIALAGSFQLLRKGKPMDQSSTILEAQGESQTESELSQEEPKPQVFYKPKTLIYIDDGILSSNSFSEPSQKTFGDLDDSALQHFAGQYRQPSLAKIEDN